jgi:ubiE/COQ5 methyltransferase family.
MEKIYKSIKSGNVTPLEKRVFSEFDLRELGKHIQADAGKDKIIANFINHIPESNRFFDWNIGSVLQHLDVQIIIKILSGEFDQRLYNSIGLAWALGEFRNTDRNITDFLYRAVKNATISDAWWRAAFSLEKLGLEEAVNLLKTSIKTKKLYNLEYYLNRLGDKRSIISILVLSNVDNIEYKIYPKIKSTFLMSKDDTTIINCCWIIGRLKLIDPDIYERLLSLISHKNYELKYYTFFALQNNATEKLRSIMENSLNDTDPLIRKMAARGILSIGNEQSLGILRQVLFHEKEEAVIGELSKTIYGLTNPLDRSKLMLESHSYKNENGMISDESDKWYRDPAIYHIFSEAEDPENICFQLARERIGKMRLHNPIDLATGTGRMIWQIVDQLNFTGELLGIDASKQMCLFVERAIKRERKFTGKIKLIQSTIADAPHLLKKKSNLIISSFGFPSKITNKLLCIKELRAVASLLSDGGLFFTIGWDETFNDELNQMWYRYIPDSIPAKDFEDWRKKRAAAITTPRNCGLAWFKRGVVAPLQFSSIKEAASVMGYLFGRDAAQYVIKSGKVEWEMSLGITCNTKEEIKNILKTRAYERN